MGNRFAASQVVDLWSLLCKTFLLSISYFLVIWSPGQEKAVAKSKYEEDVYTNNHTVRTALKFVDQVPKMTIIITNHSLISPSAPCNKTKMVISKHKNLRSGHLLSHIICMLCDCVFRVFGVHIGRKEVGAMLVVILSSETHIVLEMQGKKTRPPGLVIFLFCLASKLKLCLCRGIYTRLKVKVRYKIPPLLVVYYDKRTNYKTLSHPKACKLLLVVGYSATWLFYHASNL